MAKKIWVGGDVGNEGDYATAANWSPSGVPIAADDVVIAPGSEDIDDGLNQSAVALTSLAIASGYTGTIGSGTTAYLQIAATTITLDTAGSTVSLDGDATDMVIANTGKAADALHLLGTITGLTVFKGVVTLDAAAAVTTLTVLDAAAAVTSDATAGIATINLDDGALDFTDGDITTLNQHGGTFKFAAGSASHTLTTAHIYGGTFDCTGDENAKTITNLDMWPHTIVKMENGAASVALTNPLTYHGGKLTVDGGRTIGIT